MVIQVWCHVARGTHLDSHKVEHGTHLDIDTHLGCRVSGFCFVCAASLSCARAFMPCYKFCWFSGCRVSSILFRPLVGLVCLTHMHQAGIYPWAPPPPADNEIVGIRMWWRTL